MRYALEPRGRERVVMLQQSWPTLRTLLSDSLALPFVLHTPFSPKYPEKRPNS